MFCGVFGLVHTLDTGHASPNTPFLPFFGFGLEPLPACLDQQPIVVGLLPAYLCRLDPV
jgi:hypothetical protein